MTTSAVSITGNTAGIAGFADLGSGILFGSRTVSAADNGQLVEIGLNASAITALSSTSGLFVIGGALSTISGPADQYVFGHTATFLARQDVKLLALSVTDFTVVDPEPVPELSTTAMAFTAAGVLIIAARARFVQRRS